MGDLHSTDPGVDDHQLDHAARLARAHRVRQKMSDTPQLPLSDDDPAHMLGTPANPVLQEALKDKHPGVTMELNRIGSLYDELVRLLADAKLSKAQDDLLALEKHLGKIGSLTLHALRTVTALRVAREKKR
jgi:hypothetical protein